MAKINTAAIDGYDSMTAEQKLAALEAFEYEDNAAELDRMKKAISKANGEAADWKKKHNELLSEDEKKKQADAEALEKMEKELAELRRDKAVSESKSKFLASGYSEALADETAKALHDGDLVKFFANQQKFIVEHDKAVKAELLKGTPKPPAGAGTDGMTLEKLRKLSDEEYNKFALEHPEEYQALYEKGD